MRNNKVKRMTGIATLSATTIVLALISTYVKFGTVELNLALIPIVLGACLFGPTAGLFLGCLDGVLICLSPATITFFMSHNAIVTIVLCLAKTGLGGLASGYIYKWLKDKNSLLAVILAAVVLPIINTGLFIIGVALFFMPVYGSFTTLFEAVLTINFLIEFIVNLVLSQSLHKILKVKIK